MNAPLLTGPQPPRMPNADHAGPTRLALWLLGVGFGGFLLWASLAPLDEGVPTPGVVGVETKRKRVEHLTGGLVERILVKEGQQVMINGVHIVPGLQEVEADFPLFTYVLTVGSAEEHRGRFIKKMGPQPHGWLIWSKKSPASLR